MFILRILKQREDKEIRKIKEYKNRKREEKTENQNKCIDEMFRAVIFSLLVMNKIYVPSHFENLSNSVFTLHLYLFMNKYSIIHFVLIFLLFINTYKKSRNS